MRVIEKFVSINGEGLKQGELATFIRFEGCNLRCSYCDTKYSFINPVYKDENIEDIIKYIEEKNINNITLTGGEPLLQDDIFELVKRLSILGYNVEIETNGSIDIKKYKELKNVSLTLDYKLPISNMEKYMNLNNYNHIDKNDSVKFVCGDYNDLIRMKEIIDKYDLIKKTNCLVSPVFKKINLEDIVKFMMDNNLNGLKYCLQIHKFIWDPDKRGV